jgi:hypothetical protein
VIPRVNPGTNVNNVTYLRYFKRGRSFGVYECDCKGPITQKPDRVKMTVAILKCYITAYALVAAVFINGVALGICGLYALCEIAFILKFGYVDLSLPIVVGL